MTPTETQTAPAESSPASFEAPTDPKAYDAWLQKGDLPESPSKPEESAPSASGDTPDAESAPAAEKQESTKTKSPAEKRLEGILEDLKRAGLSPAELKTFKREAKTEIKEPAKAAPEQTAKPLESPVKPKQSDFDSYEKYEEAKDKWAEDIAEYKANLAVQKDREDRANEARQLTLNQKMKEATARYGEAAGDVIRQGASAIVGDDQIPLAVKQTINGSAILPDVLYTLASDPQELESFVNLARTDPGAALRKIGVIEYLVQQELDKGTKPETRDETGKFVATPPAKPRPAAPAPPEELSSRGSAPPDALAQAIRNDDFEKFKDLEDAKDLAKRRGR
jgi:hypothetical protein